MEYWKLNAVTHKDAHPLPRTEETLTTLTKAKHYSTLDLVNGYWQVHVSEDDRDKLHFVPLLACTNLKACHLACVMLLQHSRD